MTRAITCFVDATHPAMVAQAMALRESWLHVNSPDTDLVMFGTRAALDQLPDDVVKLEQRSVADDPEWFNYRYGNSVACLNSANAYALDDYSHILHTDCDTFITPAWNSFYPNDFVCGNGGYNNDGVVRDRIFEISKELGLTHRGLWNTGSTWYGPTVLVKRIAALSEMLCRYIYSRHFRVDEGEWPSWYGGVSSMYSAEIAINHLAPGAKKSFELDFGSDRHESIGNCVHIHCWHTDNKYSKFVMQAGGYGPDDVADLDLSVVPDYCLEMATRATAR